MDRIIWHWTAGVNKANALDKKHYHFIIEGDGTVVPGVHPPEANNPIRNPQDSTTYAAHTKGANSKAIGISLAGMRQAVERPFSPGPSPITAAQIDALVVLTADLCRKYKIQPSRRTVLSHAEVQPTLGIAQRGKWDISWLPGMSASGDPVFVGDQLRDRVVQAMTPVAAPPAPPKLVDPPVQEQQGLVSLVLTWLRALLGQGKSK
jgi:hypothetical protein